MIRLDAPRPYLEEVNPGIVRHVGTGHRVLDVGCGSGALGEAMRKLGNRVVGVECHPEAVARAATRLDGAFALDVTDAAAALRALGNERFDTLVFADVLEHLPDPFRVLSFWSGFLAEGGRLLVSVPNVAVWTMRLSLLAGIFRYDDTGVLDRTHLRFFTFATARELVEAAGFSVRIRDVEPHLVRALLPLIKGLLVPRPRGGGAPDPRAIIDSPWYKVYQRWVFPLELAMARLWKGALGFRIILVAEKISARREP